MNKRYNIFEELDKEKPSKSKKASNNLSENIFLNKTTNLCERLTHSDLSAREIEKVIDEIGKREKTRQDDSFYCFEIYADGIFLDKFNDNESRIVIHTIDLPISTSLLELIGENYTGESVSLSCFTVPSMYDPDLSDCDMGQSIRHKNIEIIAEFSFREDECLKVRLEIIKLPAHFKCAAKNQDLFNSNSEYSAFFPAEVIDLSKTELDSPVQILNTNTWIFDEPMISNAKIKVIGVGGGGGNAINRMIESGVCGIDFIAANTDIQALSYSKAPIKIQLGSKATRGLGTGSNPILGRDAAIEDNEKILDFLRGADMVFVTAGLGGGTGTGAAPVIASLARSLGILTVGVVTKPFTVEGKKRLAQAEQGLVELRECVDSVITIPNAKLCRDEEKITILDAFRRADDVLLQAVHGISGLITTPGIINLDFADIKSVMKNRGAALVGFGEARGEGAAVKAMKAAIGSRFLEDYSINGATGILTNFSCSSSTPLGDIEEALSMMAKTSNENADIFLGTTYNGHEDYVKLMFIATGDLSFSEKCLSHHYA